MRRVLFVLVLTVLCSIPAAAQNTDIEALAGLQFNFGNPGARSLGMGGAFIALADDASAAEANPAGLTILRKPEISIEGRNYLSTQTFTTSGTFPDVERTAFTHYSSRVEVTFASVVYPIKGFTVGAYYHEPLRNKGAGEVVPQTNRFTGALEKDVPNFYLAKGGTAPVSLQECINIIVRTKDPVACVEYTTNPFLTAVDVQQRTFGLAVAYKFGKWSLGATGRYQTLKEAAFTYRVSATTFLPQSIAVQATAKPDGDELKNSASKDFTFAAGVKWEPTDKLSFGAVYKKAPTFTAPTFVANSSTGFNFVELAATKFHIPDTYGAGVSFRPIPVLTINADAVRVKYSNQVDDFVSTVAGLRAIGAPFKADDVTEIHTGVEYVITTKIPISLRAGYWNEPAHVTYWNGPLNSFEAVAAAMLFPKGKAQNHWTIGAGLAWPRFQIDAAYDTSETYKVGSISMVTRF